jgi:hypothetical protein
MITFPSPAAQTCEIVVASTPRASINPKYTHFKEGQNKITAKFSCGNDARSVSHNSVNVTGVSTNTTTSIVKPNQH